MVLDDNATKLLLALLAVVQVVALAWVARGQASAATHLTAVHELVNGLAHEKDAALVVAARKEGELAGRDYVPPAS